MLYMVTFTINIPPMLAYIPYMDPMGNKPLLVIVGSLYTINHHFSFETLALEAYAGYRGYLAARVTLADPAWNVCVDIAHMSHTWCIYLHLSNFADNPYTESWSGDFIKWRLQNDSKFARKK